MQGHEWIWGHPGRRETLPQKVFFLTKRKKCLKLSEYIWLLKCQVKFLWDCETVHRWCGSSLKLGQRKEPQNMMGCGDDSAGKRHVLRTLVPFLPLRENTLSFYSQRIKAFNWLPGRSTASTEGSLGRKVRHKPWRTSVFWLAPARAQLASLHNPQLPARRKPTVNWVLLLSANNYDNLSWTCPQGCLVMTTTQLRFLCQVALSCAVLILRNK